MGSSTSTIIREQPKPLTFHRLHGENIQLSPDWRRARRLRGFEHALVLSDRPLTVNRYIDVRILDTSPAWRGAMRIGVTAQHPGALTRAQLPSCACPGLTVRDAFWVAPVPEMLATLGSELYFYVTSGGELRCSTTQAQKRRAWEEETLLSGLPSGSSLWLIIDVYGKTTQLEIFEPKTALTIVQNAPDGGAAQRCANKVRGSEDPATENAINSALFEQQEDGGQGTSSSTSACAEPTTVSGDAHLPPAPIGQLNSQDADTKPGDSDRNSNTEDAPEAITYDAETEAPSSGTETNKDGDSHVAPSSECMVCMDAVVDCTIYRCGHMCMCHACASDMKEKPEALCPVCREPIVDVIRTYQN